MSEWTYTRIRDLLETSYAGDWGAPPSPGNARILRATDIDSDGRVTGNGALRQISLATLQEKSLKKGDILLEASGGSPEKPVGRVAFFYGEECPTPSLTSNFFKTLRPAKSTSARFVHWALLRFYRQPDLLQYQQQTTGIINLKFQDYLDAILHIPCSKKEQSLIARILDTLDTQIEKTEALIAKLEKVKEGLLHDLLTRGIDENGQLRPSPEQAPELYKESPLGLIPRIWGTPLLDEISIRGSGHTPSRSNPAFWNGGVSWVSLSDSKSLDNVWIDNTAKEISMLGVANSSAVIHPAGTVVLSRDAGIGKSSVIRDQMAVSQHFMAWRCGSSLDNLFLYYWLQWMKPRFEAIALGSTIQTIGLRYFESLRIPLPPISEQKKISSILLSINERIWREQGAKNKAISKKGGLMDDLLTGRIRVTTLLEQQKEATSA